MPSSPANAANSSVSWGPPDRQEPTAPSLSQTSTRGTAPSSFSSRRCPAIKSPADLEGSIRAVIHRE